MPRIRHAQVDDGGAGGLRARNGSSKKRSHFGCNSFIIKVFRHANAGAGEARRARCIVGNGLPGGGVIAVVMTGQRVEDQTGIVGGPREGAHVVQTEIEGQHPEAAHAPGGGFEADAAAEGRRIPDGTTGIAAHGEEDHARRHGDAGPAAGTAWNPVGIMRVANGSEVGVIAGDSVGEFLHAGLAGQHRSRGGELFVDGGVLIRHMIEKDLRAERGADAFGGKDVFERVGNAVQGAAIQAAGQLFVGAPGLFESHVIGDGDEGVQSWLLFVDEAQRFARQFEGRHLAGAQFRGCLCDCQGAKAGHLPRTALSESVIAGSVVKSSFAVRGRKSASSALREGAIRSTASAGMSRPRARASAVQSVITQYYRPEWWIFSSSMERCAVNSIINTRACCAQRPDWWGPRP